MYISNSDQRLAVRGDHTLYLKYKPITKIDSTQLNKLCKRNTRMCKKYNNVQKHSDTITVLRFGLDMSGQYTLD